MTALNAPEMFVACHRVNAVHVSATLSFMCERIKGGHPLLDGQNVKCNGLVFRARCITDEAEKKACNEYMGRTTLIYGRQVEVTELFGVGVAHRYIDGLVVAPFDAMQKMRMCSMCGARECPHVALLRCSGCRMVYYCSKACQKAAWLDGHKDACKKLGKCELCGLGQCKHGLARQEQEQQQQANSAASAKPVESQKPGEGEQAAANKPNNDASEQQPSLEVDRDSDSDLDSDSESDGQAETAAQAHADADAQPNQPDAAAAEAQPHESAGETKAASADEAKTT